MLHQRIWFAALAALAHSGRCEAQTTTASASGACPTVLTPSYPAPVVGSGYIAQLVATKLEKPRGLLVDSKGALLVVQQGSGIVHIAFSDNGGTCLVVKKTTNLIDDSNVRRPLTQATRRLALTYTRYSSTMGSSFPTTAGHCSPHP